MLREDRRTRVRALALCSKRRGRAEGAHLRVGLLRDGDREYDGH